MSRRRFALALGLTATLAAGTPAEEPAPSILALPLRISASSLFARLRQETPTQASAMADWVEMPPGSGHFFHYRWTRGPLDMNWKGARFEATTRLDYGLEAGMRKRDVVPFSRSNQIMSLAQVGMGTPSQLDLHLATSVRLGEDWRIHTETQVTPTLVDGVKVPLVGIDLSKWVGQLLSAGIAQKTREFDTEVPRRLDLGPLVRRLWSALAKPQALPGGEAWIEVAPVRFVVAPVATEGDGILLKVGLEARPRLGLGAVPPSPQAAAATAVELPLPPLAAADPGDGFRLALDGEFPFAEAQEMLAKVLVGKDLPLPGGLGVRVAAARLDAAEGRPRLALDVTGALTGTVALGGTPQLDAATGDLTVPDLDYAFDAAGAAGGLAALAQRAMADRLRSELRNRARWNVGGLLRRLKRAGDAALNRSLAPGVGLAGALGEVRVDQVATTPQGFRLRMVASGSATLDATEAMAKLEKAEGP